MRNTRDLINEHTKFCVLAFAYAKRGKTTLAKTLDNFTRKYANKPTLIIALESSEGGGTMTLEGTDTEIVTPQSVEEFNAIIAGLAADTYYGGIVLDSATEYVNRFLKPYALSFPFVRGAPPQTRKLGVPEQSDYQIMGEVARMDFNKLINLTTTSNMKIRKHLLVTALQREKFSRDGKDLLSVQPDLPGAMASVATAMFQTVATIDLGVKVEPDPAKAGQTRRVSIRYLTTEATEGNKLVVGDRTHLVPNGSPLDFVEIYEKHWLSRMRKAA